jgi:hypothetical protein
MVAVALMVPVTLPVTLVPKSTPRTISPTALEGHFDRMLVVAAGQREGERAALWPLVHEIVERQLPASRVQRRQLIGGSLPDKFTFAERRAYAGWQGLRALGRPGEDASTTTTTTIAITVISVAVAPAWAISLVCPVTVRQDQRGDERRRDQPLAIWLRPAAVAGVFPRVSGELSGLLTGS